MSVVAWLRYHLVGRKKRLRAISAVVILLTCVTLLCRPRRRKESLDFVLDWPDLADGGKNDKVRLLPMTDSSLTADWLYNTSSGSFWLPSPPSDNIISGFEARTDGNQFEKAYYKNRSGFIHPDSVDILMAQGTGFNAGDFYALWIAPMVAGRLPRLPSDPRTNKCSLAVVGSILQWGARYIWGPGFIGANNILSKHTEKVFALRGPMSYKIATETFADHHSQSVTPPVYGDPGLFISWYYQPHNQTKTHSLCLIPHYVETNSPILADFRLKWHGIHVLDMRNPIFSLMDEIVQCEFVLSSSLHGLIFSDSYGIPNAHMNLTTKVQGEGFKFGDYWASMNRTGTSLQLVNRSTVDVNEIKTVMKTSTQATNINLLPLWQNAPMHAEAYNCTRQGHLHFATEYVKNFTNVLAKRPPRLDGFLSQMGIEH